MWHCKECGNTNIGRAVNGMQYINDDYFIEIFDKQMGNWDCPDCGEVEIVQRNEIENLT